MIPEGSDWKEAVAFAYGTSLVRMIELKGPENEKGGDSKEEARSSKMVEDGLW